MFTGIVEELGELVSREQRPDTAQFSVRGPLTSSDARPGDSIAVNGVCLTVVDVDGIGTLLSRAAPVDEAPWELIRIGMPAGLARYLVEKGSITVDGVSLTVIDVGADGFSAGLIPTTQQLTTLGLRRPGELVNLEVDVIAKYVERLARPHLVPRSDGAGG